MTDATIPPAMRSVAFTALLEWDEFKVLESKLGTLVVTDFVTKIEDAWAAGDTRDVFELYREYRHDITAGETTDPGVLERYALSLKAQEGRKK